MSVSKIISNELTWAQKKLKLRTDQPLLEAEILLSFALGISERSHLYWVQELSPYQSSHFRNLVMRRACYEPMAYLLGQKEFYSLNFKVDPRVLIPRFDTESLVDLVVEKVKSDTSITSFLDLGVGSGAILISVLSQFPNRKLKGVGCDISKGALELANQNAKTILPDPSMARFVTPEKCSELGPYDLVVTNLPYLSFYEWLASPPDVHVFEPSIALQSQKSLESWFSDLSLFLKRRGCLFMEWGDLPKDFESECHPFLEQAGLTLRQLINCQPKCNFLVLEKS